MKQFLKLNLKNNFDHFETISKLKTTYHWNDVYQIVYNTHILNNLVSHNIQQLCSAFVTTNLHIINRLQNLFINFAIFYTKQIFHLLVYRLNKILIRYIHTINYLYQNNK